jgi:multidrug transporter EmrE-like cation transporter
MKFTALIQLGIACAIFIVAAGSAKAWALSPSTWRIIQTLGLYTAGNVLMLRLIRQVGMATAFSVSAVLQLLAVNVVAIVFYGETIGTVQGIGLAFAVVAVALITLAPRLG